MNDLEMTRLCAEAMGWHTGRQARKVVAFFVYDSAIIAGNDKGGESVYDPLHDDAQAMALVKRFRLAIYPPTDGPRKYHKDWIAASGYDDIELGCPNRNLNRAIVECVAKMQHQVSLSSHTTEKA